MADTEQTKPPERRLKVRSVSLEASIKPVTLGQNGATGYSDGTSVRMTYSVPDDMVREELDLLLEEEQQTLDLYVLKAEHIKGTLPDDVFHARKDRIIQIYRKLREKRRGG